MARETAGATPRGEALSRLLGRRDFIRLSAGTVVGISLGPAILEACGTSSSSGGPVAVNFDGTTITLLGIQGEDGVNETKDWKTQHKVTYQPTYFASGSDLISKIKAGQSFDLAIVPNPYVQLMIAAKLLKPLDLSRTPGRDDLFPNLKNATWNRDSSGAIYSAQILWGDGPYVYNPAKVATPPTHVMQMFEAQWHKRYVIFDDPSNPFMMFGRALGFDPPNLTMDQLNEVANLSITFVKNAVGFAQGYPDATDYLVRGEADLAFSGWEAMLNMAKPKGLQLGFQFFVEAHGGGWCDSLAIPVTASNEAGAYGYINQLLTPSVNAANATDNLSGCTVAKALPLVSGDDKGLYDYKMVTDPGSPLRFESWLPPTTPPTGIAGQSDWNAAWTRVKASA